MSKTNTKTKIGEDGLRYLAKPAGSPFMPDGYFSHASASCYLCGTRRLRSTMKSRQFIGKQQLVCDPSCRPAKEATVDTPST